MDAKNKQVSSVNQVVDQAIEMVKSPCVYICCLDDQDVCLGCYRTCDEITGWGAMNNDERKDVMKKVAEREQGSGNMMTF
jgi:predicted Fe-S protein YdhL (DUF1289 family)